jgi:hypothetical protein
MKKYLTWGAIIGLAIPLLSLPILQISVATAGEDPLRLKVQSQWLEPTEGLTVMAVEDTASHDLLKTSQSHTPADLEHAFEKYFSRPWSLMIYQGWGTSSDLGQTLVFDIKFEDSYFTGLAVNRKMFPFWRYFTFELEGQVLKHYGKQEHWELDGLFLVRLHPFILASSINIEFAVGWGLSYAIQTPVIEKENRDNTSQLMSYLAFEVAFTLPEYPEWTLVTRIHHRSGMFGTFNDTYGGSNFLALGLRYHF